MYPLDRRKIALHLYSLFSSVRKTGLLVKVSHSTVHRWVKNPERKQYTRKQHAFSKTTLVVETIKTALQCNPFISLVGLKLLVQQVMNVTLSKELVRTVIHRSGFSKKKARFYGEPKDLETKTVLFIQKRDELIREGYSFVSIDETSFGRSGASIFGYSQRGTKLYVRKNVPNLKNTSVVACVSKNGLVGKQKVIGSFTQTSFLKYLEDLSLEPKTVILLDNASIHHSKIVKNFANDHELILLYTPPYSPWYNPIELCFSIVKRMYYKSQDIETSFETLSQQHCNAFFNKSLNCGYLKI